MNTLAFIFDLLIFEGNHLGNKKSRFFRMKCLYISLKMKPFSKLTSHRLCQQLKCPLTYAVLDQSVDRQHCGRSLVWAPGPDLYSESLKNNSERKVLPLFCGLASLTRRQIVSLISTLALSTLTLNVSFLKVVIPRLFPACDQALRAGMGGNVLPRTLVFIPVYAALFIFCMHYGV